MGANKAISAGSGIDVFAGSAGSLLLADLSKARRDNPATIDINRSNQLRQLSRASGQRRLSRLGRPALGTDPRGWHPVRRVLQHGQVREPL